MMVPRHLQDAASAMIGVGLMISPWIGGYSDDWVASANALVSGALVALAALGAALFARPWQSWTQAVLGFWLIASPWMLGFETHEIAMAAAVGIGIPVFLLAAWVLLAAASADEASPAPSRLSAPGRRPARRGAHGAAPSSRR
jgi:hypothetical protein